MTSEKKDDPGIEAEIASMAKTVHSLTEVEVSQHIQDFIRVVISAIEPAEQHPSWILDIVPTDKATKKAPEVLRLYQRHYLDSVTIKLCEMIRDQKITKRINFFDFLRYFSSNLNSICIIRKRPPPSEN